MGFEVYLYSRTSGRVFRIAHLPDTWRLGGKRKIKKKRGKKSSQANTYSIPQWSQDAKVLLGK